MTLRLGYALAERVVFDLVIVGKGFVEGFKLCLRLLAEGTTKSAILAHHLGSKLTTVSFGSTSLIGSIDFVQVLIHLGHERSKKL